MIMTRAGRGLESSSMINGGFTQAARRANSVEDRTNDARGGFSTMAATSA